MSVTFLARKTATAASARIRRSRFATAELAALLWCDSITVDSQHKYTGGESVWYGLIEISTDVKTGKVSTALLECHEYDPNVPVVGEMLAEADKANRRYRAADLSAVQVVRRIAIFDAE